jgi:hypothetical protein
MLGDGTENCFHHHRCRSPEQACARQQGRHRRLRSEAERASFGVSVTLHFRSEKGEKEELLMKSIAIASLFILAVGTSAQAEILCTQHRGCWETGKRLIYGNGGGVHVPDQLISYRGDKSQKVRINRKYYSNEQEFSAARLFGAASSGED